MTDQRSGDGKMTTISHKAESNGRLFGQRPLSIGISTPLRESEERFRRAFAHAAGMGLVASDGRWIQVNKSLCEMLGYSEAELLKGTFQRVTHPDDLNLIIEQLHKLREGTISSLQLEQRYFHKKGHLRWMLLSVTTANDTQNHSADLIFQMQDISDRKQAEKKLVHDAFHDALTGLPNRMFFMDQLKQSVQRVNRTQGPPFAVLFLDFDRFKIINDSLGNSRSSQGAQGHELRIWAGLLLLKGTQR